jgi:hypothetical protein
VVFGLAGMLLSCDPPSGLLGARWEAVDTNGAKGELHFVMTATDLHIALPEHVRIERVEARTVKKADGTTEAERRERTVRVVSGRCNEQFVCAVAPDPADPTQIVITPKAFGDTTLRVTVMLDDKDEVTDTLHVRAVP